MIDGDFIFTMSLNVFINLKTTWREMTHCKRPCAESARTVVSFKLQEFRSSSVVHLLFEIKSVCVCYQSVCVCVLSST